jgi:hypothetical protein
MFSKRSLQAFDGGVPKDGTRDEFHTNTIETVFRFGETTFGLEL